VSLDVSVVVATFGDRSWCDLAGRRAVPSALAQTLAPREVIPHHGTSLAQARNEAAAEATGEWLCFLDADDELDPGYLAAMTTATGDLRAPAVQYVHEDHEDPPVVFDDREIREMNPCVIGTLVRRDAFWTVGGFGEWPVYEDWALFLALALRGAVIEHVPDAVYRAHVREGSRNTPTRLSLHTYRHIRRQLVGR
jgi:glycosyltransferase involved in cell wall biosynthesis